MPTSNTKREIRERERRFDRDLLRSSFISVFWSVFNTRRKKNGYSFKQLSEDSGIDKGAISRAFRGIPNWEIDTMADVADALGVDLIVTARDRTTGEIHTDHGVESIIQTPKTSDGLKVINYRKKMGDWTKLRPVVKRIENEPPQVEAR